ncbi:MAG TPA: sulfatase-like hydrolase/transferase [Caldilineaceae bacterium]|nr:sulfatase-like hydrolase/transferase [Caldilineaceae bacterium]
MAETQRLNLLYIHSDQHNPYVTGCYGDPLVQTPNLDRLAAQGVVFDNVYCPSPICVPSRMAMLTGRHPYQNEVWTNSHILAAGIPTLAHAMGAVGYRPTLIGRMHAVGPDQLHGYAERLVGDHAPNHIGGSSVGRGVLDGTAGPERISLVKSGAGQSAYQVHDEDVAAATVAYLNQLGAQKRTVGQIEPFNLSVGLMLPHPPYVARREDYARYADGIGLPSKPIPFNQVTHPFLRAWRSHTGIEQVTDEEVRRARAAYWGLVHRVDVLVGQILAALEANGLAENTLIVYSSDHGDMQGEHGLWWKHVFYEESVKVPLILCWPGVIPGGQRRQEVISALDVNATMLDALVAPPLTGSPGRSFLGLISTVRATPPWEDVAFSEYCADEYVPTVIGGGKTYQRMIRQNEWKLIYYHGLEPQLFNLADDPGELVDRAQDPACRTIRNELTGLLLADWNPESIAVKMAALRADNRVLRVWAQRTQPADQYRWQLRPEMNWLEETG